MTAVFERFLGRLLGRMPIGWLQLVHNKGRLFAAVAGITFANLLVFVQLGIMFGLNNSILATYNQFDADIMISAVDANTLSEGGNVPRQLMFRALSSETISSAAPLFLANIEWAQSDTSTLTFQMIGLDPDSGSFLSAGLKSRMDSLRLPETILFDIGARGLQKDNMPDLERAGSFDLELGGRSVHATGFIDVGGGFSGDGTLIASDQTFLSVFNRRSSSAPDHILLKVRDGVSIEQAVQHLQAIIGADEARVRSFADAAAEDQRYQTTERPTGLIFGFGVLMGIIVGIVIVYQILSTDVADHLREYATFKAMGFPQSFFLGIVFEEALILAVLGFIPGALLSWAAHLGLAGLTGLPVSMALDRSVAVFLGTILACAVSGAIATRRLAGADPADLF